jgi:hypothetical protein
MAMTSTLRKIVVVAAVVVFLLGLAAVSFGEHICC